MNPTDHGSGYEDLWSEAEQAIEDFADGRIILDSDIYYEDGEGYYWECTVDDTPYR